MTFDVLARGRVEIWQINGDAILRHGGSLYSVSQICLQICLDLLSINSVVRRQDVLLRNTVGHIFVTRLYTSFISLDLLCHALR